MRRKLYCLAIISILLLGSVTLASGNTSKNPEEFRELPKVHIDISSIISDLGYTDENITDVPDELITKIIKSRHVCPERSDDGDYYVTLTPDSPVVNTFDTADSVQLQNVSFKSSDYRASAESSSGKACLIIAIWDYPGDNDLYYIQGAYNEVSSSVASSGVYTYWHTLTNSEATYNNVWGYITWACAEYGSVDVYLMGHGTELVIYGGPYLWYTRVAYVCYDAVYVLPILFWNFLFPSDIVSGTYDYSTLRTGVFGFCHSYDFQDEFLNPGGSTSHWRFFTGPQGIVYDNYVEAFVETWCDSWYDDDLDTWMSWYYAKNAAQQYVGDGDPFSYNGYPIYA